MVNIRVMLGYGIFTNHSAKRDENLRDKLPFAGAGLPPFGRKDPRSQNGLATRALPMAMFHRDWLNRRCHHAIRRPCVERSRDLRELTLPCCQLRLAACNHGAVATGDHHDIGRDDLPDSSKVRLRQRTVERSAAQADLQFSFSLVAHQAAMAGIEAFSKTRLKPKIDQAEARLTAEALPLRPVSIS